MKFCSCVEFKEKRTGRAPYTSAWARLQRSSNIDHLEVVLELLVRVLSVCFFAVPSCLSPHVRKFEIREIFACGIRNTAQGVWNPTNDLNPESKFPLTKTFWNPIFGSGIHSVKSRIQDCLGFPSMGR